MKGPPSQRSQYESSHERGVLVDVDPSVLFSLLHALSSLPEHGSDFLPEAA
jgi:hypothetical protein